LTYFLLRRPRLPFVSAKKNRKKVITPDDINSLFADKKQVDDEDEENEEDEADQNALTGMANHTDEPTFMTLSSF
jgi:hypothetical protein